MESNGKKAGRVVLPSLGRKWDSSRGRYVVVLKVPKWDRGTVLMCEAPLAVSCGYQRPMAQISAIAETENDDTGSTASAGASTAASAATEKAKRDTLAMAGESARLKRWLQATMKLKWKPEEILFYEILLYCRDHQPGSKQKKRRAFEKVYGPAPPPDAPPPETVDDRDKLEQKFIKSAQWLFADRKFDSRYDEKKSTRENMLQVLADTALVNDTFFSRRDKGYGWYPLLGHVRQMPVVSTEINACMWFQNSVAYLVTLTDLKLGDEIIISQNQENAHLLKQITPITPISADGGDPMMAVLYEQISANEDSQAEGLAWQRICKAVCEYGKPILDRLYNIHLQHVQATADKPTDVKKNGDDGEYAEFLVSLRENVMTYLRMQWLNVEQKKMYGKIQELVRIEFLLIYIQQLIKLMQPLPPPPPPPPPPTASPSEPKAVPSEAKAAEEKKVVGDEKKPMGVPELEDFLESMGVRKELRSAPAIKEADEQLTSEEWFLYQQIVVMANRRLMMYDLLPVLQNDPCALAYQQLWHDPKIKLPGNLPLKISLIDQWNTIANKLAKKHPSFYDKD